MEIGEISASKEMLEVMQIEQTKQSIALDTPVRKVSMGNQEEQISTLLRNLDAASSGIGLHIDAKG